MLAPAGKWRKAMSAIKWTKCLLATMAAATILGASGSLPAKTWSIKADYIEGCSCSLFCSCYYNTSPEGGMMCEFNNAVKIESAHVGEVKLDGKKFWISGDLGGDFTKGMKSAIITFEPGTTKPEKEAIVFLIGKIYPVTWASVNMDEAPITWERNGQNGHAKLGDKGEIRLEGAKGADGKPMIINNLKYWGAQKNNGFELAYSTHRYKGFGHDYKLARKNGFFIHIESSGTD
jgi:hypothetical protein